MAENNGTNKVMGILSYIWILWIVPLFAAKDSQFARFHANQGLLLWIVSVVMGIIGIVLGFIPVVGTVIKIIGWIVNVATLVLAIIGIINAVKGEMKPLPLIGGIKIIK
ncbi:MAG: hypothetical protein E7330_06830 [Clostridiales bacterium]|nr:hypothetical protein [Clostridiales bacterium]